MKIFMDKKLTHKNISFLKSVLRIIGYVFCLVWLPFGLGILVGAELLGIVEEIV